MGFKLYSPISQVLSVRAKVDNQLWGLTVSAGVLLAIPYGVLADRYGRKNILVLTLVGLTLSFAWIQLVCTMFLPISVAPLI